MNLLSLIWSPKENCLSLLSGAQEMLKSVLFLSGALRTYIELILVKLSYEEL